jgi:hypothetical protein
VVLRISPYGAVSSSGQISFIGESSIAFYTETDIIAQLGTVQNKSSVGRGPCLNEKYGSAHAKQCLARNVNEIIHEKGLNLGTFWSDIVDSNQRRRQRQWT